MTKEQFNYLSNQYIDAEIKVKADKIGIARAVNCDQGLIKIDADWYRYENCELVVEDDLADFLNAEYEVIMRPEVLSNIRNICRDEFLRDMKFPSLKDFIDNNIEGNVHKYHWFITETKRLNGT